MGFPVGDSITVAQLETAPYQSLARLQLAEPVSYLPELKAWFITGRDEAIEAMRDAERFTVDDPRFTTAQVLGESMLNLDGPEHTRHRLAFAEFFRPKALRQQFEGWLDEEAERLLRPHQGGEVELRTVLAGPLAVNTITRFLGLKNVEATEVLDWYTHISAAIVGIATGDVISEAGHSAVAQIRDRVDATLADAGHPSLVRRISEKGVLQPDEVTPATAVVMFGAIETSEGMTANALWHLFSDAELLARVHSDRTLVPALVEESLRIEPAAAVIDRYATQDAVFGSVTIPAGAMVTISLLGANRDPELFPNPEIFDITRPNLRQHLTFVQGPHGCLGLHLARAETVAAVNAVLDRFPNAVLDRQRSGAPEGLIFRKPAAVTIA